MARNYTVSTQPFARLASLGPTTVPVEVGTHAEIKGDAGPNDLMGTSGHDTIRGLDGNDTIQGRGGDDTLYGGRGIDNVFGGLDVDTLYGGAGDDSLQGTQPGLVLSAVDPCDVIFGGSGIDSLDLDYSFVRNPDTGQPVNMTVDMSTGAGQVVADGFLGESFAKMERLFLFGGNGNEVATGGAYRDTLDGNGGDDILKGAGGDDLINDSSGMIDADGGPGNDTLTLFGNQFGHSYGDTFIDADAGIFTEDGESRGTFVNFENLTVFIGSGTHTIIGFQNGVNEISAGFFGTGDKIFYGGNLDDALDGGGGEDRLYGGAGDDHLVPSEGDDWVYGGAGNDTFLGGGSAGWFYGGSGDDLLWAQSGTEKHRGGQGNDTYRFEFATASTGPAFDTIVGFDADADAFDLLEVVTGIDAAVTTGALSKDTFNPDLKAAIGNGELAADHAVLFTAAAGDYAGETFLVIDLNEDAGYQSGKDVVVHLRNPVNLNSLGSDDFI